MKRIALFSLLLILLVSCRKESAVDFWKSTSYFYSEDKTKILFDATESKLKQIIRQNYKEVPADVETFEVVHQNLGKDKEHAFYQEKKLKNVDAASFYWDADVLLPKDKNHVFYPATETDELKIIEYADPLTYKKVYLDYGCLKWYQDTSYYFYDHVKTIADKKTMSFESSFFPFDKSYIFYYKDNKMNNYAYVGNVVVIDHRTVRDNKRIFYTRGCTYDVVEIECNDANSFKYYDLENDIFGVDNKVFIIGVLIVASNLDRDTFRSLGDKYCVDKNNVYYESYILKNAESSTFEVLCNGYAKDKNRVYKDGKLLEGHKPESFNADSEGRYPDDGDYGKPRSSSSGGSRSGWRDDD